MHLLIALSLLSLYSYVSFNLLPFLLAASGLFAVGYALLAQVFTANAPPMSTRRKLMMASWSNQSEGSVFGIITVNAEPLVAYLSALTERTGTKVSVTTAVIKAVAVALKDSPSMNSRIAFGKFLPRDSIDVSCLVALDDGADLAVAKLNNVDTKTVSDLHGILRTKADKRRKHAEKDFEASKPLMAMLPVIVLEKLVAVIGYLAGALGLNIPAIGVRPFPFGSVMVTSVGMLGVEQAFVPFTPFARVPFLLVVGEAAPRAVVAADKKTIVAQQTLTLTGTLDHRFADGSEAGRLGKRIKYVLEHPEECLDDVTPALTPAQRAEAKAAARAAKKQ